MANDSAASMRRKRSSRRFSNRRRKMSGYNLFIQYMMLRNSQLGCQKTGLKRHAKVWNALSTQEKENWNRRALFHRRSPRRY